MNPGAIEEVGKVATGVIDALKTNPLMLLMIVFNALILILVFFSIRDQRAQAHELIKTMIEHCVTPRQ